MTDIIDVTHIRLLAYATSLHPSWDELRAELGVPDDDEDWTLIGLHLIEVRVRYRVPKPQRSSWRPASKRMSATERRSGRSRHLPPPSPKSTISTTIFLSGRPSSQPHPLRWTALNAGIGAGSARHRRP